MQAPQPSVVGTYGLATRSLVLVGALMFTGFAGFSFWSAAFDSEFISQSVTFAVLGSFFLGLLYFTLQIAPFLRCRILVHDEGIRLCWPSVEKNYSWLRLGSFRDRQALQLVEVFDRDGNRVLVFDYYLKGFGEVYSSIAARLPTRA